MNREIDFDELLVENDFDAGNIGLEEMIGFLLTVRFLFLKASLD